MLSAHNPEIFAGSFVMDDGLMAKLAQKAPITYVHTYVYASVCVYTYTRTLTEMFKAPLSNRHEYVCVDIDMSM